MDAVALEIEVRTRHTGGRTERWNTMRNADYSEMAA